MRSAGASLSFVDCGLESSCKLLATLRDDLANSAVYEKLGELALVEGMTKFRSAPTLSKVEPFWWLLIFAVIG